MHLKPSDQHEVFKGCVYVRDSHKILVQGGTMLAQGQFDASFGGYIFDLNKDGTKTTDSAWNCFTKSQAIKFPRADSLCFRPECEPCSVIDENGILLANSWWPITTKRAKGDPKPFIEHIEKMLPDQTDRDILIHWMAALVQNQGKKFQWSPVLQGIEGNGKSMLIACLVQCIGQKYVHTPNVSDFAKSGGKFSGWIQNRLLIGMEEVYLGGDRSVLDVLKPMITNTIIESQKKGIDQITVENRANFMFCTNYKDAIGKTATDRRYAIFYTAQQYMGDLQRDGMTGNYFPRLWDWLRDGGYAIVNDYLHTYPLIDALNPAKDCVRAPITSSTREAIFTCRTEEEQAIMDAIEEGQWGFRGGWLSNRAIERWMKANKIRQNYRKRLDLIQSIGYVEHPFLYNNNGRVHVRFEEGYLGFGNPKLYLRRGHPALQLKDNADITQHYLRAQGDHKYNDRILQKIRSDEKAA